ncbi:MAG: hypothetical protein JRH10_17505 [Deltaproteobacteria bacterium]|nr:hypothetical protein [Deltaproteobacteria bacterium]MBW2448232.1 hypothetical protein [Deltaproteobacteria bacterium]
MSEKTDPLRDRRQALEEEFFRKENVRLAADLRLKRMAEESKAAMQRVSGIDDEAVLGKLVELGIGAGTLAAMTLVPLVEVAWADGKMDRKEREAILKGAEAQGVEPGSDAFALLEDWLANRPPPRLLAAWRDYIGALCDEMLPEDRKQLKREVLSRARAVAEAAGGFLGMGDKVSLEEEQVYGILETAFKV